jgi:endonuclease V
MSDESLPAPVSLNHTRWHAEDIDPAKLASWQATQRDLLSRRISLPLDPSSVRTIAGVDISFSPTSSRAVAALVLLPFPPSPSTPPLYTAVHVAESLAEPYCAGYLAFREAPLYRALFARLRADRPDLYPPDVTLVDGHGVWHPRALGSAAHLGAALDVRTVGVAKTFFALPDAGVVDERRAFDAALPVAEVAGSDGRVYGAAVRTGASRKHVFVSEGHRVDLAGSVAVVQACSTYRIPEPIRRADLEGRRVVRELGI